MLPALASFEGVILISTEMVGTWEPFGVKPQQEVSLRRSGIFAPLVLSFLSLRTEEGSDQGGSQTPFHTN